MTLSEADIWRLNHMLEAIAHIEVCVSQKESADKFMETALEKFIQNIGEMAKGVSLEIRLLYSEVPWSNIIGMRNILVHEYYKIKNERIWDVAEHKIPALKNWIEGILANHMENKIINEGEKDGK